MAEIAEVKSAREFLDENILSFEDVLANKELHDLAMWSENNLCNGAALHIILEDGNYADDNVEYCLNYIKSGEWDKDCEENDYSYLEDDNKKMLRILELMKPLTEEQREMIIEGKTITEELFDLLYNKALS